MLASLKRVIIFAGDVQKCAAFFRDAFDLPSIPSIYPPTEWMELDAGNGFRLAFHQAHGPDGPINSPTGGPMNPHKIVFYAADVSATREELVHRGVDMQRVHVSGDLHLCDGQDPEGHRFQISNRP